VTMTNRELVNSVLLTIGYVLLFLGVAHKVTFVTEKSAIIIIVAGLVILYFREELAKRIPVKIASTIMVQTIGLILLFLGFENYMRSYLEQYWWIYIIIGALIFNYAAKISKSISKKEETISI
jgi:hypothetical protein